MIDRNTKNQSIFTAIETTVTMRMKKGTLRGSWNAEHNVSVFCANDDDPNGPSISDLYQGWGVSNGGRFCDQRNFHLPYLHEFKLSGSYPLPFGLDTGAVFQSYPGVERVITWSVPAASFPGGRTNSETIILTKPGSLHYPRWNQLDVNLRKTFRSGRKTFSMQLDLFNALNANVISGANNSIGSSLGQVTSILIGRMPRIAFQVRW
jgi:hypothetical protein